MINVITGWVKYVSLALVVTAFCAGCSNADESSGKKIRILGVGNSYTINSTKFLKQIIDADDSIDAEVCVAYIGGCPMDKHVRLSKLAEENNDNPEAQKYDYVRRGNSTLKHKTLKDILTDGKWDYVTIQQLSTKSYKPETFYPYAKELYDYIKKCQPEAEIVIHETWVHRNDSNRCKTIQPEEMYKRLHANYKKIARELDCRRIPVGTAMQIAKKNPFWQYVAPTKEELDNLKSPELPDAEKKSLNAGYRWRKNKEGQYYLSMDGHHASKYGEYLGGLVWYEFFFDKDARKMPYKLDSLSDEQADSLREAAHEAMLLIKEEDK